MTKIAIIGAGVAGLTLANKLTGIADITIYEKSRGVGGRMSTRRMDDVHFDHGCPFFEVTSLSFKTFLRESLTEDALVLWHNNQQVAVPSMSSFCKQLSVGLNVLLNQTVTQLKRSNNQWVVQTPQSASHYDWVICTAPAEQTRALLSPHCSIPDLSSYSQYTAMLNYGDNLVIDKPWVKPCNDLIHTAITNSQKPKRSGPTTCVVHSALDLPSRVSIETFCQSVISALPSLLGFEPQSPIGITPHTWRLAQTKDTANQPFILDQQTQLAACGDWCLGATVESSYTSSALLAKTLTNLCHTIR